MKSIKVKSYTQNIKEDIKIGDENSGLGVGKSKLEKRIVDALRYAKMCREGAKKASALGDEVLADQLTERAEDYEKLAHDWNKDIISSEEDEKQANKEACEQAAKIAKQAANEAEEAADRAEQAAQDAEAEATRTKEKADQSGTEDAKNRAMQAQQNAANAKQAAEEAKQAAEEAKQHASASKQAAEAGDAKTAKTEASEAKNARNRANKAADKAEQAADNNKNNKSDADKAENAANEAQDAADAAQNAADEANAKANKDGSQESKDAAGKAQAAADAAKEAANKASEAAKAAQDAENKGDSETAKSEAQKASEAADAAKDAAQQAQQAAGQSSDNSDSSDSNSDSSDSSDGSDSSDSNSDSQQQSGNSDSSDGGSQSSQEQVKDPFADDEDIPQLPQGGGSGEQKQRDPTIDEIIDHLQKLDGDAKRGAIDGLKDLLSGKKKQESLTEAINKSIRDFSDDEWNDLADDTIDLLNKIKPPKRIQDVQGRKAKIKKWHDSPSVRQQLQDEEEDNARRDEIRKRQREYQQNLDAYGDLHTIEEFELDFERCIDDQVDLVTQEYKTYDEINPEYEDEGIIMKADVFKRVPDDVIPTIGLFYDKSGSCASYIPRCDQAIATVKEKYVDTGMCVLEAWEFGDYVRPLGHGNVGGSTEAWPEIIEKIKERDYKNVIIMSDSDIGSQNNHGEGDTVEGCVWWIWREGSRAARCVKQLRGAQHNYECEIS